MAEQQKDTIYIDLDDEITAIIDKVRGSSRKIVALVLPKRATVLQSIVNMRLLKRTADEAKKHIVLITSEAGILPLAGAVKVHVAKTLQTKPAIPPPPTTPDNTPLTVNEDTADETTDIDTTKSIGELAGLPSEPEDETIELEDEEPEKAAADKPKKKGKKLSIPNFNKFRTRLLLGGLGLILLIVLWYLAYFVMPKAVVTIKTDNTSFATSIDLTASPALKDIDKPSKTVPAISKEFKKTDATKVPATGEKDIGTKATGTMTVYYCPNNNSTQTTVPAGSIFSSSGLSFRTDETVTVPASNFTGGGLCKKDLSSTVKVTADQAGDKYNLSSRDYASNLSGISGHGTAMTGGTTNIVKVVSQSDVDAAKQKVLDQNQETGKTELIKQLNDGGYLPIPDTFGVSNTVVTSTPNVGDQATEVNVSVTITYSMLGAKLDDVKQLVEEEAKKQIDTSKQTILDNGLDNAVFRDVNKQSNGDVKFTLQTEVVAGVQQDVAGIKKAIAGKKRGDAEAIIGSRPGVKEVNMKFSPFWVYKTPTRTGKIIIIFEQADSGKDSGASNRDNNSSTP
jgi:hypothetical protein